MAAQADRTLDLRGYLCPWSEVIARRTADRMQKGQVLLILSDDRRSIGAVSALFAKEARAVVETGEDARGCYYCRVRF